MRNLDNYERRFNAAFPKYSDDIYRQLLVLLAKYRDVSVLETIGSKQFRDFFKIILPLVAIKNYKSQIPFPKDLPNIIRCAVTIKTTEVDTSNRFANHEAVFKKLVDAEGFELATVSAVFHFCHPTSFPIIDKNVVRACKALAQKYGTDFQGLALPALPRASQTAEVKLLRYKQFIVFIDRIRNLQALHMKSTRPPNYRYIDKALMVYGTQMRQAQARQGDNA